MTHPSAEARQVTAGATLLTFVGRVATVVLGVGMALLTSRFLNPSARGVYTLSVLGAILTATLLGQVGGAVTHELRRNTNAPQTIVGQALGLAMLLGVVAGLLAWPVIALLVKGPAGPALWIALGVAPLVVWQTECAALAGLGRMRAWNAMQLTPQLVMVAITAVLVGGLGHGISGAVIGWDIAQFVAAAVGLCYLGRPRFDLLRGRQRQLLSLGLRLGVVNVISIVNYRIEIVILEAVKTLHAVGVYSIAVALAELVWVAGAVISVVTTAPVVTQADDRAVETICRSMRRVLAMAVVIALALAVVAVPLIPTVFGSAFAGARGPLLVLLPGVVLFAPASTLALYFSVRLGRTRYPLVASILSGAVTALLTFALVPSLGPLGAATACTIGYATGMGFATRKFLRLEHLPLRSVIPGLADLRADVASLRGVVTRQA